MENLYLFEAGATKTSLMYTVDGQKKEQLLPGFNPNIDYAPFEIAVQEGIEIPTNAHVVLYGSGLSTNENIAVVKRIFEDFELDRLRIHDDILGASRAAFGNQEGIVSIMGTGGLAAYYDGAKVVKRRGGYGYLIDDLGGGFSLGQEVLSAWLNGDLSEEQEKSLISETGSKAKEYAAKVYETKDPKLIAELSKLIAPFKEDQNITALLKEYFERFITKNVKPLSADFNCGSYSLIGSVGTEFHRVLRAASAAQSVQLEQCIQSPITRLFDYHSR